MTMRRLIVFFAFTFGMPLVTAADPVPEYSMKAAFLYNFALFTEWPALPDGTLNLCVFGKDPFGPALDAIAGKEVNGMRLTVARLGNTRIVKGCQILFLGETESMNVRRILKELGDMPVLTVTDDDSLVAAGVIIGMSVEDRRLTFQVNAEAARRAHLAISSKLLRLAKTVY